ncbi:oxidoreductase FAD/NAD(P)-binding domain protein [Leadbetterella byssophila DSM 17132]|uniref:Oxidoreductase FAD/NAD(P)-binding domain protein n=1 Tax=Leadbetterella byssophila (strain DSM 17132 / JCM 16389 / KACC 11308 / NBRC 106382 / 4M15) TaxID=649349 RepID=E4RRT5_LEAB4|nr:ferredoxin--NADP reductase [Leadbetterella byssophila]ADQ17622.1 oxidoreductase FAD/NAD(P)-binding domain protein [Leadbetterella byssophila DSM 17132]
MNSYFLQVQKIVQETEDTVSIHFWHPISGQISYEAGQFLTVLIPGPDGKKVRRSYSFSSSPVTDSGLAITVKRVPGGLVSNYLVDHVKAGDFLEVLPPMGRFTYTETEGNLVFIGAGSGITPLMSLIKTLLRTTNKKILLIYGNRNEHSIIFKEQLRELESTYRGRFTVVYILSRPGDYWVGHKGRIHEANVIWFMKDHGVDFKNDSFYMCGPEKMMDDLQKVYTLFEIPEDRIHYERFNAPTIEEDEILPEQTAQTVTVKYDGETHVFEVAPHQTILEAALELDIDLPYSCQAGMCTACLGKCLEGQVKMDEDDGLTDKEKDEGYVLTCVSRPQGPGVVIEID